MNDKKAFSPVLQKEFDSYLKWLKKQPLSEHTRRAYRNRIHRFLEFLDRSGEDLIELVSNSSARLHVLKEYKRHSKKHLKLLPSTVNANLTALDNFFQYLGAGKTKMQREDLPQELPQSLAEDEQKKFLRAVAGCKRAKDRAIAHLLFYSGARIEECANLELDDVSVIGRKNRIIIRNGKGDRYREIPLHKEACDSVLAWLGERKQKFERDEKFQGKEIASSLFLNPQGKILSTASIDLIVRKIGDSCGLEISAHKLRHTFLTNLYQQTKNIVLVAEMAGHKRLETTRKYTLPSQKEKEAAIQEL